MTSAPSPKTTVERPSTGENGNLQPRLKLKPKSPTITGHVDGAWWPRSRDLAAELPALVSALAVRLDGIERISYRLPEWDPSVRKLRLSGSVVHLSGYQFLTANTVAIFARRQQISLLVVPAETSPQVAARALMTAAERGNTDTTSELLLKSAVPRWADAGETPLDEQRWELDGGHVRTVS